jgi:hypothetical protein
VENDLIVVPVILFFISAWGHFVFGSISLIFGSASDFQLIWTVMGASIGRIPWSSGSFRLLLGTTKCNRS